jgi:phage internal scaffolding protein
MPNVHIRNAYSREPGPTIEFTGPSMTKQSFKASCDINNILVKYQKTGVFDHVKQYEGQYFDATEADYHESMNTVVQAQQMFDDLPSKAREYFNNDPAKFLAFFDENGQQSTELLYELGLAIGTQNGSELHPTDARYEGTESNESSSSDSE